MPNMFIIPSRPYQVLLFGLETIPNESFNMSHRKSTECHLIGILSISWKFRQGPCLFLQSTKNVFIL